METCKIGDVIRDKYEVTRILGKGGMGVVLEALHRELGEPVAIKFPRPGLREEPEAVARFKQEARAGMRIKNLHVAQVYDVDTVDGLPFIVMEHLTGRDQAEQTAVVNFANAGGRIFATHFSYVWFIDPSPATWTNPFSTTATWAPAQNDPSPDPQTAYINQSFTEGSTLAQWLKDVGATTTLGQLSLNTLRHDFDNVVSPSELWVSLGAPTIPPGTDPMMYSFETPVGSPAAQQCGRAIFNDFHVENATTSGMLFPNECPAGPMTAQEKLLEYTLFDLASCVVVPPPPPPECTPGTCASQAYNCGSAGDGCGNVLNCGSCSAPSTCGGGGQPGVCGNPYCAP